MFPDSPICSEYTWHSFSLVRTALVDIFRLNKIFKTDFKTGQNFSDNITWQYHMTISHYNITWQYHITISHYNITWQYHITISHDNITWQYHITSSSSQRKKVNHAVKLAENTDSVSKPLLYILMVLEINNFTLLIFCFFSPRYHHVVRISYNRIMSYYVMSS